MSNWPINPADLFVIVVVMLSALVALVRGFVRELLTLLAWAGAILVTLWGFSYLRPYARDLVSQPLIADVLAGAALFVVSLVAFSLLAGALSPLVRNTTLSALDRTLGFIFGVGRGAVVVALAWLALTWAVPPAEHPPWIKEARALPLVQQVADFLRGLAPPELRGQVNAPPSEIERRARQAQEAERALRALSTPAVNAPPRQGETGYRAEDRRGLDRLLQSADPAQPGPPAR